MLTSTARQSTQKSTQRTDRSPNELITIVLVVLAAIVFVAFVAFSALQQYSVLATAHVIAGTAIVALALPFLFLSGILMQAFVRWSGLKLASGKFG